MKIGRDRIHTLTFANWKPSAKFGASLGTLEAPPLPVHIKILVIAQSTLHHASHSMDSNKCVCVCAQ